MPSSVSTLNLAAPRSRRGADESGTLERLKACRRELVDPAIEEFHRRVIKLMGDDALVEFASVVDAVQCTAVIHRKMAGRDQAFLKSSESNSALASRQGAERPDHCDHNQQPGIQKWTRIVASTAD